jgi:hypothetical protein
MENNEPIDLEAQASGIPSVQAREVSNPDNERLDNGVVPIQTEPKKQQDPAKISKDMAERLRFIPENLHDRVKALTREELVGVGIPQDREAYNAYLYAEKMLRDEARRVMKKASRDSSSPETFDA